MASFRSHLPALVLFAVVAALLLYPALGSLGSAIPGHPQSDAYEHVQGYWWVADSLRHGEFPWRTAAFGVPSEGVLWFPDTIGALLALPITLLGGAPLAYCGLVFTQVWAASVAAYVLGFHVSRSRAAGVLAGVVFGASPFVLGLVHSGVSEYLHLAAFPALWLAGERALSRGGRWVFAAALAWAWLGWANAYYAMFGAFVLPLVWLAGVEVGWRVWVPRMAAVVAIAAVLVFPVALVIRESISASTAVLREESAPGWSWVYLPANDVASFVFPGDQLFPDFRDNGNFGIRHVSYLGWVALIAAAFVWRRWWRPMLLAGVLALGPSLHWRGQPVKVGSHFVPLPAALLYLPGSPFRAVHHPYRMTVLPLLVLAAAAADALRKRPGLALSAASLALGETLLVSPGHWPIDTAPLSGVATLPESGGVWDLPPDFRAQNRRWMGLQAVHGRRIPYTINVFLPAPWRGNQLYQSVMGCLDHPDHATIARDARPPLGVWLLHDSPQTLEQGIAEVRGWGIRYVVVHEDVLNARESKCFGKLLMQGGAVEVPQGEGSERAFDFGGG
ncbi:hypothetical protein LBMAG42_21330 [Deltaproteobacteria bacterium]|nr:hypothetical protein LBMAG42_21330 [Deltaproteobacteria bacterium]